MNHTDGVWLIFLILLVVGLGMASFYWGRIRSRWMIEEWAQQNNLTILGAEYKWFSRGPFFWTSSKGQTVYRITAITPEGHHHTGWARCGGFFMGLLTNKVTVKWDNPQPNPTGGFPVILRERNPDRTA